MTQKHRNDTHEGWFHVTNRGARKYDVFIDDDDRARFVRLLAKYAGEQRIEVASFCLMANHFHLALHCPKGNLSTLMQRLGSVYTRHFNRDHGFSGPLFERRFHSPAISTDEYLLMATRYIHRNPLEVGLDIESYPWSSYLSYTEGIAPPEQLIVSSETPLELAGGPGAYRTFVRTDLPTDRAKLADGTKRLDPKRRRRTRPSLDQIDQAFISEQSLTGIAAPYDDARRRMMAVLVAVDLGAYSLREIAKHHGYATEGSARGALRSARQRSESDVEVAQLLSRAFERLSPAQVSDSRAM